MDQTELVCVCACAFVRGMDREREIELLGNGKHSSRCRWSVENDFLAACLSPSDPRVTHCCEGWQISQPGLKSCTNNAQIILLFCF